MVMKLLTNKKLQIKNSIFKYLCILKIFLEYMDICIVPAVQK